MTLTEGMLCVIAVCSMVQAIWIFHIMFQVSEIKEHIEEAGRDK
jgi:hypothetical protein